MCMDGDDSGWSPYTRFLVVRSSHGARRNGGLHDVGQMHQGIGLSSMTVRSLANCIRHIRISSGSIASLA